MKAEDSTELGIAPRDQTPWPALIFGLPNRSGRPTYCTYCRSLNHKTEEWGLGIRTCSIIV